MMKHRFPVLLLSLLSAGPLTAPALAQDKTDQKLKAYGSRIGDRRTDPDSDRLISGRRIDNRLDTRIDSRLNTRLERFSAPQTDEKPAYTPQVDDGTKAKR